MRVLNHDPLGGADAEQLRISYTSKEVILSYCYVNICKHIIRKIKVFILTQPLKQFFRQAGKILIILDIDTAREPFDFSEKLCTIL